MTPWKMTVYDGYILLPICQEMSITMFKQTYVSGFVY